MKLINGSCCCWIGRYCSTSGQWYEYWPLDTTNRIVRDENFSQDLILSVAIHYSPYSVLCGMSRSFYCQPGGFYYSEALSMIRSVTSQWGTLQFKKCRRQGYGHKLSWEILNQFMMFCLYFCLPTFGRRDRIDETLFGSWSVLPTM